MKFEHISILKGSLSEKEANDEIKKYDDYLKEHNLEVTSFENLGLKKLAYPIQKNNEGIYIIYNFNCEKKDLKVLKDFENFTKENNNTLKFINVRLENELENENEEESEL